MRLKFPFFASLLVLQGLSASHESIDKYLEYLASSPNFGRCGDYTKGEMQIVDDRDLILQIEEKYYNEFLKKGYSSLEAEKCSRVGVVEEDTYWLWLRDPLILPNGKTTAYNRFVSKRTLLHGIPGVAVMALSKEKKILLNIIFRHATREWEMELPKGGREQDESSEQAALRELKEETGIKGSNALKIASIASESGVVSSIMDFLLVTDLSTAKTNREDCEAIDNCVFKSKNAIKQALIDGFVEIEMHGNKIKVFCRDPFLASAFLIAEAKGLL